MAAPVQYADMQYAYEFTLDKAQIPSADTYVPVYIPLPAEICAACLVPLGSEIFDLVVTLEDGTALPRAVINHSVEYNPTHANVGLLVRVPVVDPISGAPKLYVQYKGSQIATEIVLDMIYAVYDNVFGGTLHSQMAGFPIADLNKFTDRSINREIFTKGGDTTLVTGGPIGYAIRFDGDDYLSFPHVAGMRGGDGTTIFPRTIITIAKANDLTTALYLLVKGGSPTTVDYIANIAANSGSNFLNNVEFDGAQANNRQRRSNTGYGDTTNYHIEVRTADGGNISTAGRIYRDGVRVDTTAFTSGSFTAPDGDNAATWIGRSETIYSKGDIAAVIHIDGALSENQALYQYRMFSQFLAGTIGAYGELIPFFKTVPVEDGFRHGFGIGIGIGF